MLIDVDIPAKQHICHMVVVTGNCGMQKILPEVVDLIDVVNRINERIKLVVFPMSHEVRNVQKIHKSSLSR